MINATEFPLPLELMLHHRVIPLQCDKQTLTLGITTKTNQTAIAEISFHTGLHIQSVIISEEELSQQLAELTIDNKHAVLHSQLTSTLARITIQEEAPTAIDNDDEPVTEFVNKLIDDAIHKCVSDIHLEPYATQCRIRFRRDGLLYEAATIPAHLFKRISTRIKIMAHLNIAECRLPQDGRIPLRDQSMELRVSTCPTLFGEKFVLRLLNNQIMALDIHALGLTSEQADLLLTKLNAPQGLILVTGPTGSGKTITLYSALRYLNQIEKNILTVEDPVEIELSGINQVNTNTAIGLDAATVLRAFLRQDPDIIMLGEIRDLKTAIIAMQAAQTGHLVLATLHANSTVETLTRLQVLGIDTYHLISSVSLIIAQRLIRKRCLHCSHGCNECHQGYSGRTGIFELLPITKTIIDLVTKNAGSEQLLAHVKHEKWLLLQDAGLLKIQHGITDKNELMRVLINS